jgi:hypothetical protein
MAKKKASAPLKDGAPCRWCDGKYREVVKRPAVSTVTPTRFRFTVDHIAKEFGARVFICDSCGHVEFLNVKEQIEDPNA